MTSYVLDNSVAMRWLLGASKLSEQRYALEVFESTRGEEALVPNLWHLEAANALLDAVNRGETGRKEVDGFVNNLEAMPIAVDSHTAKHALRRTLDLAAIYGLTSYDAAYLELAMRRNVPLATLDRRLARSAERAGVSLHLRGRS